MLQIYSQLVKGTGNSLALGLTSKVECDFNLAGLNP